MSDRVFYGLAVFIILVGVVVVGAIVAIRQADSVEVVANSDPTPTTPPLSEGCAAMNNLLEAPRTMLIREDMGVTLTLTGSAKPFMAGEVVYVAGISTPQSTSWIHFLQIDRILPDGTLEPNQYRAATPGYPKSYADVKTLLARYEIMEDGWYNLRSRLIFFEQRSANEGTFTNVWCERPAP